MTCANATGRRARGGRGGPPRALSPPLHSRYGAPAGAADEAGVAPGAPPPRAARVFNGHGVGGGRARWEIKRLSWHRLIRLICGGEARGAASPVINDRRNRPSSARERRARSSAGVNSVGRREVATDPLYYDLFVLFLMNTTAIRRTDHRKRIDVRRQRDCPARRSAARVRPARVIAQFVPSLF
ncbi:hypothetical protein EVAR_88599_1 [Eumeta japonica]|uniref:Uncharacterized protein n=1 Tax=Eumeta variegata TaxID=151549 RepID=A0A4C2A662_EUMVA|nr:hypothetical protein EVAR_88599_1 [Eumeta japonica]